MTLPPEVRADATRALAESAPPRPEAPEVQPEPRPAGVKARVKSSVRRAVKPALDRVIPRALGPVLRELDAVRAQLDGATARIDELERRRVSFAPDAVGSAVLVEELHANSINQTLLKAEFGDVLRRFEELGMAIAPAAGIDAAAARLAEQREHLASLDRRLRLLDARVGAQKNASTPGSGPDSTTETASTGARPDDVPGFDYVGFERRFRGAPDDVLRVQRERYVPLLAGHSPVVDIGCGRGELLEALAEVGTEGIGVEPEPGMAAEARARSLHIEETDAVAFLRAAEPGSLGAVFSAHVVEHVELDYLLEFIHLAASRLRPGGIFVAETPNPASLIVLGNSYILDPTHVRPLHPSLLAFLCENAGFRDVRLNFYSPAEGYHLPAVDAGSSDLADAVDRGFRHLDNVLFGPQEYTVVATRGPA